MSGRVGDSGGIPVTGTPRRKRVLTEDRYPNTKAWDNARRERYVRENDGLVRSIVSSIQDIPDVALSKEDLYQEALIALWGAFDKYDPARGAMLSTYVHKVMRNAINEVLRSRNASKRKPPVPIIPYDSGKDVNGADLPGADNMEMVSSASGEMLSVEQHYEQKEIAAYVHHCLQTMFSKEEQRIFLALSQGEQTQMALAHELNCSQAKISMTYAFVRIRLYYELSTKGYV